MDIEKIKSKKNNEKKVFVKIKPFIFERFPDAFESQRIKINKFFETKGK